MMRRVSIFLFAAAGLLPSPGARAVPESLLRNSPFQPTGSAAPTTAPPSRLELRGLFSEGGVPRFSIFDAGSSRAYWIGLNEADGGIRVVSYDAASSSIMVEADGQAQRLVMKEAQIVALAVPSPTQPNTIIAPPGNLPPPPGAAGLGNPTGTPPSDQEIQERRNRIVEELRRRRALRGNGPPAPPPSAPAQQ